MGQCPPAARVQPALQRIDEGHALGVAAVFQRADGVVVVGQQPALVPQAERHGVEHRRVRVERGFLHDAGDAGAGGDPGVAAVQVRLSGQDAKQRRLAGAVAPDEPDAFARVDLELGILQQRMVAERQAGARQRDQRHAGSLSRARGVVACGSDRLTRERERASRCRIRRAACARRACRVRN